MLGGREINLKWLESSLFIGKVYCSNKKKSCQWFSVCTNMQCQKVQTNRQTFTCIRLIAEPKVPGSLQFPVYSIPPLGFYWCFVVLIILFFPTSICPEALYFWTESYRSNRKNISALWAWFIFYLACVQWCAVSQRSWNWEIITEIMMWF